MSKPMTLRLSDEEKAEAMKKAEAWGLTTLSAVIRLALRKLKQPK